MVEAALKIENALADAVSFAVLHGDPGFLERILKLVIKKEIVLELLIEELRES